MPIDLANVNISLDQFQRISSGKYNAGEVKLGSETTLSMMNNHVHLRRKNVETISHEETLAIKNALVRALADGGVSTAAVDAVRRELGLDPDGPHDRTLAERSVKPLSRQQIRDILDRTAPTVNGQRLSSYADLHAGYRASRLASIAAKREATNAALVDSRAVSHSAGILRAQTLVSGEVDFHPYEERKALMELALKQKNLILERSGGNPSTAPDGTLEVKSDNGLSLTLQLGMSEADYVDKLDDMILRLDENCLLTAADLAVRQDFLALADDAARANWVAAHPVATNADGRQLRTIAVLLMHDRGIGDEATLAIVNKLDAADVKSLAAALVGPDRSLAGDALRQSATLRSFASRAASQPAGPADAAKAFIPALSTARYNQVIANGLSLYNDKLPQAYVKLANTIRDTVAARLGERAIVAGGRINTLFDINHITANVQHAPQRVSPASIQGTLLADALRQGAMKLITDNAIAVAARLGTPVKLELPVRNNIVAHHPDLLDDLAACQTPEAAAAVLAGIADDVEAAVRAQSAIERCTAKALDWTLEAIAGELHISVPSEEEVGYTFLRKLEVETKELGFRIGNGQTAASTAEEIEAAFRELASTIARERVDFVDRVSALPLSESARLFFRDVGFNVYKTSFVDFNVIFNEAPKLDFKPVVARIGAGEPTAQIMADLKALFEKARDASNAICAPQGFGGEEFATIRNFILCAAADAAPGFINAIGSLFARPDAQAAFDSDDMRELASVLRLFIHPQKGPATALTLRNVQQAFLNGPGAAATLQQGFHPAELPDIARAFALCVASGMDDATALAAVTDPASKPMRLFRAGGRFTESVGDFRKGLALMDSFPTWFAKTLADGPNGRQPTAGNMRFANITASTERAVEKFLFEAIAFDRDIPLDPADPEASFGMGNNPALRFVGRDFAHSCANTLDQLPPSRRALLYAVFDALNPIAPAGQANPPVTIVRNVLLVSRVLANYDAIEALQNTGDLDRAHLVPLLFSDFGVAADADNAALNAAIDERIAKLMSVDFADNQILVASAAIMLENSGAAVGQVVSAARAGRSLPNAPGMASFAFGLEGLDGTPRKALAQLREDMRRAQNPSSTDSPETPLLTPENCRYAFVFPDGAKLHAEKGAPTDENVIASADAIAGRIEAFCGPRHPAQITAVYSALSQSSKGAVMGGFIAQGIASSEHMPVVFTFSKDDATGAVTIRYSEPAGFPFRFHWETTVALDGTATSTPMVIE